MPTADEVIVEFEARLGKYEADIKRGTATFERSVAVHTKGLADIERRGFEMGQSIKKGFLLAKAAIAGFYTTLTIDAVGKAIIKGLEYAASLGTQAQQLGVTTDALQEYRYAASQVGIEQATMDQGLRQLTLTIGKAATGGKEQIKTFAALGISIRDASGNIRDAGNLIPEIADALSRIPDPARRAAVETRLFGEAGQKLDTLLAGGAAAINGLRDAAYRLGIVLSSEQIEKADITAKKLEDIKKVLEARIAGVVTENANAVLALANALATLAEKSLSAVAAFERFKLRQGAFEAGVNSDLYAWSPLPSDQAKSRAYAARRDQFLNALKGPDTTGSFRDYRKAPLFPNGAGRPTPNVGTPDISGLNASDPRARRARAGRSGPSAAEIEHRFNNELASLLSQTNSAYGSIARSAQERAELEQRNVELARIRTEDGIKADKNYSKAQKAILLEQVEFLAEAERAAIEFNRRRQLEQEANDLAQERFRNEQDQLRNQYDLAGSQSERKRLALAMVDLEERYTRSLLESILASETATNAEKERARIALEALGRISAGNRANASRANETPAEQYLRELRKSPEAINEAIEDIQIRGLEKLNDELVDAIMHAKSLGDVFSSVADQVIADLLRIAIQQSITAPLAGALFGGSGTGALFGSLFGRAIGGPAQAGRPYVVGENGRELFVPQQNGVVIPNHRLSASASPTVVQLQVVEGQMFEPKVRSISGDVSVRVVRQSAPSLIGEAVRQSSKQVPTRMAQYQRDGF